MDAALFGRAEKLKRRKQIEILFAEGKSLAVPPVRVKYLFEPPAEGSAVQAGVSVSRKSFKRAVDRNRLKRLLREAYRLQKHGLLKKVAAADRRLILFFIYTGKTIAAFDVIYAAMAQCLHQLEQKKELHHESDR